MADQVIIAPYDKEWPIMFRVLGTQLREALGDIAIRIDHIGSTSINGLAAKPIIDVQISVADFEPLDRYRIPLENCGFVYRSQNPDLTKRYFRETPGDRRTHIHMRRHGSFSQQFALLFRDYMRVHPEDAANYAELKRELAKQFIDNRLAYVDAKAPFIWNTMRKADNWAQHTGWTPCPSDA